MILLDFKKIIASFNYASEGIVYAIKTQRNMKIHFLISLLVLLLCMGFHVNKVEAIFIFLCIALIMSAEIFNTSVEIIVDAFIQEYHPKAKAAKDLAAGGVLISVFFVVIVGLTVLFPHILNFIINPNNIGKVEPIVFIALQGMFLFLFTYVIKAYWYNKKDSYQPSIILGLFFYIIIIVSSLFFNDFLILLILVIILFYIVFSRISWIVIIQNGIISIGGFYLTFWLLY